MLFGKFFVTISRAYIEIGKKELYNSSNKYKTKEVQI